MYIYGNQIYPFLVSRMGDPKPIREIRKRIIGQAGGVVLEIGAGSGANFVHYDPTRVTKLYALEPNPGMIRLAERQRLRTKLDVEYLGLLGERIPLEDRSVDSIVSTFTLGTIPDVVEALRGMRRVLRPGGEKARELRKKEQYNPPSLPALSCFQLFQRNLRFGFKSSSSPKNRHV